MFEALFVFSVSMSMGGVARGSCVVSSGNDTDNGRGAARASCARAAASEIGRGADPLGLAGDSGGSNVHQLLLFPLCLRVMTRSASP